MSPVTHQTVRLSKGRHSSPEEGACVMELASMLAGEPFTDHPMSVCPVIGSFLRAYNDTVGDERRQDLYAYASRIVGSRVPEATQRHRIERLLEWTAAMQQRRVTRFLVPPALRGWRRRPPIDAIGAHAVRAIPKHNDESHAAVIALLDELLALGATADAGAQPGPDRSAAQ